MRAFSDLVDEDRRLVILSCLKDDGGYSNNEFVIQAYAKEVGHDVSRDRIRTDLQWLEEQGLVTIKTVVNLHVATISQRGLDVAYGRTTVPGVKRPGPRSS